MSDHLTRAAGVTAAWAACELLLRMQATVEATRPAPAPAPEPAADQ